MKLSLSIGPPACCLDAVVTDSGGGVQRLADLTLGELTAAFGIVGPGTGEAVGLQLQGDRVLVGP